MLMRILLVSAVLVCGGATARADVTAPGGAYGPVTLAAATAKAVGGSLVGRKAILVANLDAATIYCGWDASVTASTGFPILTNTTQRFDAGYIATSGPSSTAASATLFCFSTAGTAANGVRWTEFR